MKNQAFIKLVEEKNEAYIDLDSYGVTLVRGWREALLAPPSIKALITNDNRLEHGLAVMAKSANIKKDKRDVSLSFYLEGIDEDDYLQKYKNFLEKIAYGGQFCLKVPCLKQVFKFVYTSCTKYGDYGLKKGNFTLKLTEYNPEDRAAL